MHHQIFLFNFITHSHVLNSDVLRGAGGRLLSVTGVCPLAFFQRALGCKRAKTTCSQSRRPCHCSNQQLGVPPTCCLGRRHLQAPSMRAAGSCCLLSPLWDQRGCSSLFRRGPSSPVRGALPQREDEVPVLALMHQGSLSNSHVYMCVCVHVVCMHLHV